MNINKTILGATLALSIVISYNPGKVFANVYSAGVSKNHLKIEKFIEKGRLSEAKELVDRILKNNPDDLNARAYLGTIYSSRYKLDAAEREYRRVLQQDPNNAAAHNGLGLVFYRRTTSSDMEVRKRIPQYLNAALVEFSRAINNAPDYYQAHNNAGQILFKLGRIGEAEQFFKKALELKPDYSEAVENYGRVLFSKNNLDGAIEQYRQAIRLNSKNSSAYYHYGEALIAKGRYSDAIRHLQISLYLFPNSAPVHNMLGKSYELQGNEAAAIAEYKKSYMIKPEFTDPYLRLADIYKNRGDEELAISELRNSLAINPGFTEAKAKIADISLNIGKFDEAIKNYRELRNHPRYQNQALKGLSRAYFLKAQQINTDISDLEFIEVENSIKRAIDYDPENLELYLALLRISRVSHKENQSEFSLNRIVKNTDNSGINHIIKGEAFLAYKDFNKAEKEFVQSLNKTKSHEDLLKLAEIFTINRAYSVARIATNRVIADNPNNLKAKRILQRIDRNEQQAETKLQIAEGFYDEGQKKAAIEAYRDALSLNPYLDKAHLGIAKAFEKEKYYYNALEHYRAYVSLVDIGRDTEKYRKKVVKLERKIEKLQKKKKPIKKFTRI